jgi:hypothetical protein
MYSRIADIICSLWRIRPKKSMDNSREKQGDRQDAALDITPSENCKNF